MKSATVIAKAPGKDGAAGKECSIIVQVPESLKEAESVYGAESVLSNALSNWTVTLQGNIRSGLRKGEDLKSIQARLSGAKMGVTQSGARIDPVQAFLSMFASASPQEKAKYLAELEKRTE